MTKRFSCESTLNPDVTQSPYAIRVKLNQDQKQVSEALKDEPGIVCFASTGLPQHHAALACELAAFYSDWTLSNTKGINAAIFEPDALAEEVLLLQSKIKSTELLLAQVENQITQVQCFGLTLSTEFAQSADDPTSLKLLAQNLAIDMEIAGLEYEVPNHLCGWSTLLNGALKQLQEVRMLCHRRIEAKKDKLERLQMQNQLLQIISAGADVLVDCLESPQNTAPETSGSRRALMHLKQHTRQPHTKCWLWMLDESGENDDWDELDPDLSLMDAHQQSR